MNKGRFIFNISSFDSNLRRGNYIMSNKHKNTVNCIYKTSKFDRFSKSLKNQRDLWLMTLAMLIWAGIFCYYPMYGLIIAFKKYTPGQSFLHGKWVGIEYFKQFIMSPDFGKVIRNTLAISGLNIIFGFPAPIILALLINELRIKWYKKFVQTVSYLPHFISWVVTASITFYILSYNGSFNSLLISLGIIDSPINWLSEGKYFWGIITVANIWKSVGWSSIIYLSAIAGIDQELYEAGAVDGLSRFQMIRYITIPGISVTIVLLFILGLGDILNAGFEQQLLLGNDMTRDFYEVIDTYAYKYGLQLGRYSYATAVSLMKGIISIALVFLANHFSRKKMDVSLL